MAKKPRKFYCEKLNPHRYMIFKHVKEVNRLEVFFYRESAILLKRFCEFINPQIHNNFALYIALIKPRREDIYLISIQEFIYVLLCVSL